MTLEKELRNRFIMSKIRYSLLSDSMDYPCDWGGYDDEDSNISLAKNKCDIIVKVGRVFAFDKFSEAALAFRSATLSKNFCHYYRLQVYIVNPETNVPHNIGLQIEKKDWLFKREVEVFANLIWEVLRCLYKYNFDQMVTNRCLGLGYTEEMLDGTEYVIPVDDLLGEYSHHLSTGELRLVSNVVISSCSRTNGESD